VVPGFEFGPVFRILFRPKTSLMIMSSRVVSCRVGPYQPPVKVCMAHLRS